MALADDCGGDEARESTSPGWGGASCRRRPTPLPGPRPLLQYLLIVRNLEQAAPEAADALEHGFSGVWLAPAHTEHDLQLALLEKVLPELRALHPGAWLGVCLPPGYMSRKEASRRFTSADGLWLEASYLSPPQVCQCRGSPPAPLLYRAATHPLGQVSPRTPVAGTPPRRRCTCLSMSPAPQPPSPAQSPRESAKTPNGHTANITNGNGHSVGMTYGLPPVPCRMNGKPPSPPPSEMTESVSLVAPSTPPREGSGLRRRAQLRMGGLHLHVRYTMRDGNGALSPAGRSAMVKSIEAMHTSCDAVCITSEGCSAQELVSVVRHTERPLALHIPGLTPRTMAFFRGKDVLLLVGEDVLFTYDHKACRRAVDKNKVDRLRHALVPPPPLPISAETPDSLLDFRESVRKLRGPRTLDQSMNNYHLVFVEPRFKVYVGDAFPTPQQLHELDVKWIVNCAEADGVKDILGLAQSRSGYIGLDVQDLVDEDPTEQWPAIMRFMHDARLKGGGSLYIHCWAGKNRSVVTLATWMVVDKIFADLDMALAWIEECRPLINPKPRYIQYANTFVSSYTHNFREIVGCLRAAGEAVVSPHISLAFAEGRFRVYIGDIEAYANPEVLIRENVKYVINCSASDGLGFALPGHQDVAYIELFSDDESHESQGRTDPRTQWPAIMRFMHRARLKREGNMFIHCMQGKNRSVVTLAVWLAVEKLVPTVDAGVQWIKSVRPIVHPQVRYLSWGREFVSKFDLE